MVTRALVLALAIMPASGCLLAFEMLDRDSAGGSAVGASNDGGGDAGDAGGGGGDAGGGDAGDACVPTGSCPSVFKCGVVPDGCGGQLICGICTAPQNCSEHACVCTTCLDLLNGTTTLGAESLCSGAGDALTALRECACSTPGSCAASCTAPLCDVTSADAPCLSCLMSGCAAAMMNCAAH